jgi:uncharacterized protein
MPEITPQNRDFIHLGKSPIEGTGVFAKRAIPRGTRIIEYIGDRVPINALYHVIDEGRPYHLYGFALNDTTAIDGAVNGNDARFFNHSCEPNCEPYNFGGQVYIYAMRDILPREELTFDYRLGPVDTTLPLGDDESHYKCVCGTASCRGTLLAPPQPHSEEIPGDRR